LLPYKLPYSCRLDSFTLKREEYRTLIPNVLNDTDKTTKPIPIIVKPYLKAGSHILESKARSHSLESRYGELGVEADFVRIVVTGEMWQIQNDDNSNDDNLNDRQLERGQLER
jgi:hypothetical protein